MKDSIRRKLEKLDERFEEISRLLSDPGVISNRNQFRELSMEYDKLGTVVERYRGYVALEGDVQTAVELDMDEELRDLSLIHISPTPKGPAKCTSAKAPSSRQFKLACHPCEPTATAARPSSFHEVSCRRNVTR